MVVRDAPSCSKATDCKVSYRAFPNHPEKTLHMAETTDSLIEYPCDFPIKVMGLNVDGFIPAISFVARQFDPSWQESSIETRESKGGKYLGLTLTVHMHNREQLDELYRTLSSHPMVKVVL